MKRQLLFAALTLAASPLLLSGEGRGTEIAFSVSSGTTLTKTFEITLDFTLDEFAMTVNGQEQPVSLEQNAQGVVTLVFEDAYEDVSDGRPTSISRTYETLGSATEVTIEAEEAGGTRNEDMSLVEGSILEGETIEFEWNGKAESYTTVLPDGSTLEEDDVEGLLEDTDFRALLPDDEVDEGDEWEIDISKAQGIFSPGGDLRFITEDAPDYDSMDEALNGDQGTLYDHFNEDCEGDLMAVFDGIQKTDDGEFAVIQLSFEISNALDRTEESQEQLEESDAYPPGIDKAEFEHHDIEVTYEGEGILLWDLKAGHFHSFEASGEYVLLQEYGILAEIGVQEILLGFTLETSGSITYAVSAE